MRWFLLTFASSTPPRLPTVSIPLRLTVSDFILPISFHIAHRLTFWATTQRPTIPFWVSDSPTCRLNHWTSLARRHEKKSVHELTHQTPIFAIRSKIRVYRPSIFFTRPTIHVIRPSIQRLMTLLLSTSSSHDAALK